MTSTPTSGSGTLSVFCQHEGHHNCPALIRRARPGILSGIQYIHHPQPMQGESLSYQDLRCICVCHQANPPQIMP